MGVYCTPLRIPNAGSGASVLPVSAFWSVVAKSFLRDRLAILLEYFSIFLHYFRRWEIHPLTIIPITVVIHRITMGHGETVLVGIRGMTI